MNKNKLYISELDGLRALAILSVLAVHAGTPGFKFGWLGVDLFFALSGFLITTLLLNEFSSQGKIGLRNFWIRRFLRLMPVYMLYALFVSMGIWLWEGSIIQEHGGWSPLEYTLSLWLYVINYAPKGGIWNGQDITIHLWSLAVEEQYYLVWPLIMAAFISCALYLRIATWTLFIAVLSYFVFFANSFEQANMLYARGMSLFLASAVAVSLHNSQDTFWLSFRKWLEVNVNFLFILAIISTILVSFALEKNLMTKINVIAYILPLINFIFVLLVAAIWYSGDKKYCFNILNQPILVYIGKISYGIYIYHELVRVLTWHLTDDLVAGWGQYSAYGFRLSAYVALTILLATFSYYAFERKFLRIKRRYRL